MDRLNTATIKLPPKMVGLFTPPRGDLRFRVAHGGRGSGKSFTFALMAAVFGYVEPLRILCTREFQVSIKDSMHAEIKNAIESIPWLAAHYEIGEAYIRGKNGTEFLFRGLRHNISNIKSMAQIDLCIVEEAADIPEYSWQGLLPTIRAPKSEIWCVYNPKRSTDPVDKMFRANTPPRSMVVEISYMDNPWFPPELEEQRRHAQKVMNPSDYAWIWEGKYLESSDAQVFNGKWAIDEFEPAPGWNGPYFGADFGFAQDPNTLTKAWVHNDCLYIEYETGGIGVELDEMPALYDLIPGARDHVIRADCARPETISHLKRRGFKIEAAPKWQGSVEDGVEFIRGTFDKIIIHPRCKRTAEEFRLYSYKQDKLTGDILPIITDDWNHYIDSIRYALSPLIKRKPKGFFDLG